MAMKIYFVAVLLALSYFVEGRPFEDEEGAVPNGGKNWVLLVAGSKYWRNYRHQADISHAYQLVRERGIPDENIVVMMYDDIAQNKRNPRGGAIINKPRGPDVYDGIKIDYRGKDVNPSVFLDVLQGIPPAARKGTGRVIKSGPNDHIFVNFVGHGSIGFLNFPNENLLASNFSRVLKTMSEQKQFSKMLLYIEACFSGSMFQNFLPNNINVLAVTAASPNESSWACYNDRRTQTWLGDHFSVNWMHASEAADLRYETIQRQVALVKEVTTKSRVSQYGQLDVGNSELSTFLGRKPVKWTTFDPCTNVVRNVDANLKALQQQLEDTSKFTFDIAGEREQLEQEIHEIIDARQSADLVFQKIVSFAAQGDESLIERFTRQDFSLDQNNVKCYEQAINYFDQICLKITESPYVSSTHFFKLVNMCSHQPDVENIRSAMEKACGQADIPARVL